MKMKKIMVLAVSFLAIMFIAGCSKSGLKNQEQNQAGTMGGEQNQNRKGQSREMPAEFASACENKNEGDSCELTMPKRKGDESGEDKKMTGTCKKTQDDKLACMPEGGQGGPRNRGMEKPSN